MSVPICQYVSRSICPYVSMPICRYVHAPVCLSDHMSLCRDVNMSQCPYANMSLNEYVNMSACQHVYIYICQCQYVTMYLGICRYILHIRIIGTCMLTQLHVTSCTNAANHTPNREDGTKLHATLAQTSADTYPRCKHPCAHTHSYRHIQFRTHNTYMYSNYKYNT